MPNKVVCRRIPVKLITAKGKKKKGFRWLVVRPGYGFIQEDVTMYETFQDAVNSSYAFGAASDSHSFGRNWYGSTMMDIEVKSTDVVSNVKYDIRG